MGGIGSGRRRCAPSLCLEHLMRIDVRKAAWLEPGAQGRWSWTFGDQLIGTANYRTFTDRLHLEYGDQRKSGVHPHHLDVLFSRSPCHYGGYRTWLLCPHCAQRAAVLYGYSEGFACRRCIRLPYAVELESRHDRMLRKSWKIRDRLGDTPGLLQPIPESARLKGMHWTTFERLVERDYLAKFLLTERAWKLCCLAEKQFRRWLPLESGEFGLELGARAGEGK